MAELKWKNYPVVGMPGNITGNYGDWYSGATHPHMGTDVGIVIGTPVYAPADGIAVEMTNDGSFGLAVCLQHPDTGWWSAYCHLSSKLVAIGEEVKAGELLGISGNTGYSTGPHLHWQVCNTPAFWANAAYNRDPMKVPFETEDEMTPDERSLLLLTASVVGGWTNGQEFTSVQEALGNMRIFEDQDQRILVGLGVLNDCINEVGNALANHLDDDVPEDIRSAVNTLRDVQRRTILGARPVQYLETVPPPSGEPEPVNKMDWEKHKLRRQ